MITNLGEDFNKIFDGSSNYEFVASIASNDNLDNGNTTRITFNVDVSSAYDLGAGISKYDTIIVTSLKADIKIPSTDCSIYQYLCMSVTVPSGASYTDGNLDNSHTCLQMGNVEDGYGGINPCTNSGSTGTNTNVSLVIMVLVLNSILP
uniref:Uncharacterized protein LOC100366469 n=1 Tax=Saccoglossus kowalevskii TaxID=10224 RepID=A0ABM0MJD2_SACKO|nr:PREDICTED: uncharacterized protein LOC100366469 [Saccoglossus kowalevskii]